MVSFGYRDEEQPKKVRKLPKEFLKIIKNKKFRVKEINKLNLLLYHKIKLLHNNLFYYIIYKE